MKKTLLALALFTAVGAASAAFTGAFCDSTQFDILWQVGAAGGMLLAVCMALAYMIGSIIHEPRLTEWAKSQPQQMLLSMFFLIIIYGLVQMECNLPFGSLADTAGTKPIRGVDNTTVAYSAAQRYLNWGAEETLVTLTAIRREMGAYNLMATVTEFDPDGGGLKSLVGQGESMQKNSGYYTLSGVLGSLLNMNTIFLLTIYFLYYSLMLFSSGSGLILVLVPIGFTLRHVPFFRGFGGALAGLGVALFFLYPMMLAFFAVTLGGIYSGSDATDLFGSLSSVQNAERALDMDAIDVLWNVPSTTPDFLSFFRLTALNSLRAIFFPTAGLIAIVTFTRDLSRLFGEEMDASRLVQFV